MISYFKEKPHRDRKYLEYLSTLPCAVCNAYSPSEAAHQRLLSGGMGSKPHDRHSLPLCPAHHRIEHTCGPVIAWQYVRPEGFRDKHELREYLKELCEIYYFDYISSFVP